MFATGCAHVVSFRNRSVATEVCTMRSTLSLSVLRWTLDNWPWCPPTQAKASWDTTANVIPHREVEVATVKEFVLYNSALNNYAMPDACHSQQVL